MRSRRSVSRLVGSLARYVVLCSCVALRYVMFDNCIAIDCIAIDCSMDIDMDIDIDMHVVLLVCKVYGIVHDDMDHH